MLLSTVMVNWQHRSCNLNVVLCQWHTGSAGTTAAHTAGHSSRGAEQETWTHGEVEERRIPEQKKYLGESSRLNIADETGSGDMAPVLRVTGSLLQAGDTAFNPRHWLHPPVRFCPQTFTATSACRKITQASAEIMHLVPQMFPFSCMHSNSSKAINTITATHTVH